MAYAVVVWLGLAQTALFLFSISPLMVLWVVFRILKDPHPVEIRFEDEFYQDGSRPRSS